MKKMQGFLMVESMVAVIISVVAVSCLYLTVVQSQKNGRSLELKTDRAYAYHIFTSSHLRQIVVHDRIYEKAGQHRIYDKEAKQEFIIEK